MENDNENKLKSHDEQKENIKNVVQTNKDRTHDEAALGSQNGSVNRFGVLGNDKRDSEDKKNIRNKIDASKARNLQESGNAQYIPNGGDMGLPSDEEINPSYDEYSDNSASGSSGGRNSVNLSSLRKDKENAQNTSEGGKKLLGKKKEKAGKAGEAARTASKGAKTAGKAVKEGEKTAKVASGAGKTIGTASKAAVKAISKLISFLASMFGVPVLVVIGILLLVIFIIVLIYIIMNSYGTKFGIDYPKVEEILREDEDLLEYLDKYNNGTIEGLTRDEVDDMLGDYVCKLTLWDRVRNFFGHPDLTQPCVVLHWIRDEIEDREKKGDDQERHSHDVKVKTTDELAPGYLFATLYYAFDTQNLDEDGELYIPLVVSGHTRHDSEGKDLFTEVITDLDTITTLLNTKKLDTCKGVDSEGNPTNCEPIYKKEDILKLLDNYIFFEDHHNDDPNHGDGPYIYKNYKYGMPYWLYQYIVVGYDEHGEEIWDWACVQQVPETFYTDALKFKLYLRYGEDVMDEYERDKNWNLQWQKTSDTCKNWSGWTKWANGDLERDGSVSLDPPPSMNKYNKKADPYSTANDNAKVTIESGTYGYDSGFIYKTYPRYNEKYITVPRDYDYKIDKEIEKIIETIDSRQDYTNYFLGYESSVQQYLAGINGSGASGSIGINCSFDIGGKSVSDIKIRLKHANKNTSVPDKYQNQPIEGQDLIDFEQYILGVVYAEVNGYPLEVQKAQAVAAASWILSSKNIINENGVNIIEISNSTWDQTYCDPDKGCDICYSSNRNTLSLYTKGTVPEGAQCEHHFNPLPSDSPLRAAIKEVVGQVVTSRDGSIVYTGYGNGEQDRWKEWVEADPKLDYVGIIQNQYIKDNDYFISDPNCKLTAFGDWLWPTESGWKITSRFGNRNSPTAGASSNHRGVDIGGLPLNSKIYAIGDGTITSMGYNESMGNYIWIDHGNGYSSVYMHMNSHANGLYTGSSVTAGQNIGFLGSTGISTGPHLHLGIQLDGKYIDPVELFPTIY